MATERITLQEAADRLGVHYMTVYRYVRTGRLRAERDGVLWMVDPGHLAEVRPSAPRGRRPASSGADRPIGELVDRMVAGDEAGAWSVLEAAMVAGLEPLDALLDLVAPALRTVGDGWESGRWSVADEHRASAVAARLISRLGPRFARRGRTRGTVVIGGAPGERHALASAILRDVLRGAGFEVVDLGADTPAPSFAEAAAGASRLVAVLVGSTTSGHDRDVRAAVRAARSIGAPVLVGGAAVADARHAERLGADGWSGPDGRSAVAAVEQLAAGQSRSSTTWTTEMRRSRKPASQ